MKHLFLGLLAFTFTLSATAAARLVTGTERENYIKALSIALHSAAFDCTRTQDGAVTTGKQSGSGAAQYFTTSIAERRLYVDDQVGSQPVFQMAGKAASGNDHTTSYQSDAAYKKIVKVVYQETVMREQNIGDLLHPNFQQVPVTVFMSQCKASL